MAPGRRTRILVVDDSAVMRSLLRSVFRTAPNIEVVGAAADGESALHLVETLHPDLVLLDVEMPVMDGVSTLRKLRERGHMMPIIMCSALTTRGARVTIEAAGRRRIRTTWRSPGARPALPRPFRRWRATCCPRSPL